MNDFCTFACGTNIFEDLAPRYARVSREEVLKRDPDALLLVAMGDVTPEEEKYWRNFTSLSAVKRNLIFVITAPEIVAPTPSAFARGVEIIAGLLHGIEITP
jgi:iron complex transport system substrate-binding protein